MEIEKEREAFEAYMAEKYKYLMDRRKCLNNGGGYMAWDMNVAWQVWQAAKAQAIPAGYVLVPKEPTREMIEAGMGNFCFPLDNGRFYNHDLIFAYRAMIEAREQSTGASQ